MDREGYGSMQSATRTGRRLATAFLAALMILGAVAAVFAPSASAHPTDSATTVTVPDLARGDAVLRAWRSYSITSCSATAVSLSLFVQTSTGRWVKVATSANPEQSGTCPFSGSPWLQTYNWTVNQVGSPATSDGPNRLNLAIGTEAPRSRFVAPVWPSAPAYTD
jgi:hypothetical protein